MNECIEQAKQIALNGDMAARILLFVMIARAIAEETENKVDNKIVAWIHFACRIAGLKVHKKNNDKEDDE